MRLTTERPLQRTSIFERKSTKPIQTEIQIINKWIKNCYLSRVSKKWGALKSDLTNCDWKSQRKEMETEKSSEEVSIKNLTNFSKYYHTSRRNEKENHI